MDADSATKALDLAPIGVWMADNDGQVYWVNQALAGFLSLSADDLTGRAEEEILTRHFLAAGDNSNLFQILGQSGARDRWLLSIDQPLGDADTENTVRYFVDVTEMLSLRAECDRLTLQLENAATSDAMTGLLNKRALMMALEPQVSRSRRYQNPLSMVAMRLHSYKAEGGQKAPVESQVVTAIAYFLRDQLRWVDFIGRTDDKEFMLVLPETTQNDAQKLIDKLLTHLDSIPFPDDPDVSLSVKLQFGVASWQKGDDVSLLLSRVREALSKSEQATEAEV